MTCIPLFLSPSGLRDAQGPRDVQGHRVVSPRVPPLPARPRRRPPVPLRPLGRPGRRHGPPLGRHGPVRRRHLGPRRLLPQVARAPAPHRVARGQVQKVRREGGRGERRPGRGGGEDGAAGRWRRGGGRGPGRGLRRVDLVVCLLD